MEHYLHSEEKEKTIWEEGVRNYMNEQKATVLSSPPAEYTTSEGADAADPAGQAAQKAYEEAVLHFQRQVEGGTTAS